MLIETHPGMSAFARGEGRVPMPADAIVFDVDDTLYDLAEPYRAAYAEVFAGTYDLPVDALFTKSRWYSDRALDLLTAGKISEEDHKVLRVQWTFADWGVDVSRADALRFQAAYAAAQEHITPYPEAVEALDACAAAGVPVGIISNGDAPHQRRKLHLLGLDKRVDERLVVVSGDYNVHKPALVLFEAMEGLLGASGAGIWYVGDTYETDIVGAKRAGWSAIWVDVRGRAVPDVPERPDKVVHSPAQMRDAVFALLKT